MRSLLRSFGFAVQLRQAALCQAEAVARFQPIVIMVNLNADQGSTPCWAQGIAARRKVDLILHRVLVQMRLLLPVGVLSCLIVGFRLILLFGLILRLLGGGLGFRLLPWSTYLACVLVLVVDGSRASEAGLNILSSFERNDVDSAWLGWSVAAEGGLLQAYTEAGGPLPCESVPFVGTCRLRIGHTLMGGEPASLLQRPNWADPVDTAFVPYFFCYSMAPVSLCRRRILSSMDVLSSVRRTAFSERRRFIVCLVECGLQTWSLWSNLVPAPGVAECHTKSELSAHQMPVPADLRTGCPR